MRPVKIILTLAAVALTYSNAELAAGNSRTFDDFETRPPIHTLAGTSAAPRDLTPKQVKTAYGLPAAGAEFSGKTALDAHFTAAHPITFAASSGDDGTGASWPAVAPSVIAVGGTSLSVDTAGRFVSEKAWSGSGGGVSAYEHEPQFQVGYDIPRAGGKRAIPDVSYAADPAARILGLPFGGRHSA